MDSPRLAGHAPKSRPCGHRGLLALAWSLSLAIFVSLAFTAQAQEEEGSSDRGGFLSLFGDTDKLDFDDEPGASQRDPQDVAPEEPGNSSDLPRSDGLDQIDPAQSIPAIAMPNLQAEGQSANAKTYMNSIGMEFVLIPEGSFMMWTNNDDSQSKNVQLKKRPPHQETIAKPFYIGKYEVTNKQAAAVMGTEVPGGAERGDYPLDNVSWNDARDFIDRLNQMEGHDRYRLPTEAEWEYAARAGSTSRYSFGDDSESLEEYAWCAPSYGAGESHSVGLKKPNAWGLHDMQGHVWELVSDIVWSYSGFRGEVSYMLNQDPETPPDPLWDTYDPELRNSLRLARGGSYRNKDCDLYVYQEITPGSDNVAGQDPRGFRVVLDVESDDAQKALQKALQDVAMAAPDNSTDLPRSDGLDQTDPAQSVPAAAKPDLGPTEPDAQKLGEPAEPVKATPAESTGPAQGEPAEPAEPKTTAPIEPAPVEPTGPAQAEPSGPAASIPVEPAEPAEPAGPAQGEPSGPKPVEPTGQTLDEPVGPVAVVAPGSSEAVPVEVRGATLSAPGEPSPVGGQDASSPASGNNSFGVGGTAVASLPAAGNSSGGQPAAAHAGQVPSRDEVRALLRANPPASTADLEAALSLLETAPGSEEQVFLVARVLAKREPKYHHRLGLFFDPADDGPKGGVTPNVMYAYDEYKSAGDLPEAVANLRRLSDWVKANGATAKGVDGIEEFERVLSTD